MRYWNYSKKPKRFGGKPPAVAVRDVYVLLNFKPQRRWPPRGFICFV